MERKQYSKGLFIGIVILVLAFVAMFPLSIWINKATNIEKSLSGDILQGLVTDIDVNTEPPPAPPVTMSFEGRRSSYYKDAGTALLLPTRDNWKTFGDRDWEFLGKAPWGLLNTVHSNLQDPALISFSFSRAPVITAFMGRGDVQNIIKDPNAFYALLKNEEKLQTFFGYTAVKDALANPQVVRAVGGSGLIDSLLKTPAAQYFIKNPRSLAKTIDESPALSALKSNEAVAKALRENKNTANIATIILN